MELSNEEFNRLLELGYSPTFSGITGFAEACYEMNALSDLIDLGSGELFEPSDADKKARGAELPDGSPLGDAFIHAIELAMYWYALDNEYL